MFYLLELVLLKLADALKRTGPTVPPTAEDVCFARADATPALESLSGSQDSGF
jgi:hypothetical protein